MPTETGTISAVKQRDKTYSIAMNKQWFGGYGKCPLEKGDAATIEYNENGKFKNIASIKKEAVQEKPIIQRPRDDPVVDDIHLQVCLKAAGQVFSGQKPTAKELAEYSRELMKELWGQNHGS